MKKEKFHESKQSAGVIRGFHLHSGRYASDSEVAAVSEERNEHRRGVREMNEGPLFAKSKAFALRVVRLYQYLRRQKESVMSKQVLRSGTSIGANIAEGRFSQSREDFIHKHSIALKETSETLYWLTLLYDAGYLPKTDSTLSIQSDCEELLRLLVASVKTAKANKDRATNSE